MCACELSDILEMTVPAVSQHLCRLRDEGMIESEREAQTIFNSLTKEYERMLKPLFKIPDEDNILPPV